MRAQRNYVVDDLAKQSVEISRYNPSWFIEHVLGQLNLCDQWQIDIIEAVIDVRRFLEGKKTVINHKGLNRITIRSCHGPGKTHALALLLHWWNYCYYGLAVGTAPKQEQIKTRFMPRYRKIRSAADKTYQSLQQVDSLKISICRDPDWGYTGETASDPDNMSGFHDKPQLVLVDEASAKTLDPMYPVVEGALSTAGSVLVLIGNPTRTQGEFWASHNKRGTKELYFQFHIPPEASRYVDMKWISTQERKYGKDSHIFQVRCLGNFADQEDDQLYALSWIEDSRHGWSEDGSARKMRITIDVADGGEDDSIITIAYLYESFTVLMKMYRFSFPKGETCVKLSEAAQRIAESWGYNESNNDDIVVDVIGVGAGMPGNLKQHEVNGKPIRSIIMHVNGSTENVDTKKWRNQRVRSYMVARDAFRDEHLFIDPGFCEDDDWEEYLAQSCSIKTKPGLERIEDLVSKQEMKSKGIKSPDMPDGTAMVFSTMSPVFVGNYFEPVLFGTMETANAEFV